MKRKTIVPMEINDHYRLYGKEAWEVEYKDKCPICKTRFDEFEYCACDAGGD